MKKMKNSISLLILSLVLVTSACNPPTLEQQNQQNLINSIKDPTVVIPSLDRGAISGNIGFDVGTVKPSEIRVQIIRDQDIPKVDSNGKPLDINNKIITDINNQKAAFLEKKGDVIKNISLNGKTQFLLSDIRPGDIVLQFNAAKLEQAQAKATVIAGKVTQIPDVTISAIASTSNTTTIQNINGKVVRPNGDPVANAKVSDVTGGFVNNFTNTASDGTFTLPVTSFTTARNLEVALGDITTSSSITSAQTDTLVIPLVPNSRTVKGTLFDAVNKTKPVANVLVKVDGANTSTTTDANGNFTLRGVPITATSLQIGDTEGYINFKTLVPQSNTSAEFTIQNLFIKPIGNLYVNFRAESSTPSNNTVPPCGFSQKLVHTSKDDVTGTCYYSNAYIYPEGLTGTIQLEGTNIVKEFKYPPTRTEIKKSYISDSDTAAATEDITLYQANDLFSVPISQIPGGEYSISIAMSLHQVQKSLRIVIPSNDTISTEAILMKRVIQVISTGDIIGKIIIKDINGNATTLDSGLQIRLRALNDPIDLSSTTVNSAGKTVTAAESLLQSNYGTADANNSYRLIDVPTGTKQVVAAVFNSDGTINTNYLVTAYTLLNVVSGVITTAPDMNMIKR